MVLKLEDVSLGYGLREVVREISFEIAQGEIVGLIGPNGCGKSTLIKGISGLLSLKRGKIWLLGRELFRYKREEIAQRVAVVPQNSALPELFTVEEMVLMGRTPYLGFLRFEGKRDREIVYKAMELTGVLSLARRRLGELSGGERQRVIIARALAQQPKLILLDEPTTHLDINHQVEILRLIFSLSRQEGLACLMVLHDLNLAAQFCPRLIMLSGGKLFAQGPPQQILTRHNIREVYGLEVFLLSHPNNQQPVIVPKVY